MLEFLPLPACSWKVKGVTAHSRPGIVAPSHSLTQSQDVPRLQRTPHSQQIPFPPFLTPSVPDAGVPPLNPASLLSAAIAG